MAWELDPAHTLIEFSAKHMMITTVKGRFNLFNGRIDLEEDNPAASVVDVTIDAASLDTGQARVNTYHRPERLLHIRQQSRMVQQNRHQRAGPLGHRGLRPGYRPLEHRAHAGALSVA